MSNNKLKENKQLLAEDYQTFVTASPWIVFGLTALVGWAMKKWMPGFRTYGGKNSQTGINQRLADSIDELYKDKEFVKDFVKILQTNADIINDFNFQTRYFQIFSDKKNITKIYLYKINNVKKMSVESFFINKNSQKIINEAIDVLKNFNIKINVNADSLVQKVDSRFNIVSIKDEVIINEFLRKTESSNLLPGAWLIYGRDNKIHHYMNELKKRNFIN
jgi:hypothetical protein